MKQIPMKTFSFDLTTDIHDETTEARYYVGGKNKAGGPQVRSLGITECSQK